LENNYFFSLSKVKHKYKLSIIIAISKTINEEIIPIESAKNPSITAGIPKPT
jgi:hypothetical protein